MKKSSCSAVFFYTAFAVCAMCHFATVPCFAASPLRNWPVVERGEHDANVRAIQLLLTAHHYPTSADGLFGSATQRALRQFQEAHSLIATGKMNNPTWEALVVTVHQGSTGPAVQAAQFELRDEGYAVATDGSFDAKMRATVQKYQKMTGNATDGVVGRMTWYELVGGYDPVGD